MGTAGGEVIEGDENLEPRLVFVAVAATRQIDGTSVSALSPSLLCFRTLAGTAGTDKLLAALSSRRTLSRPAADWPFSQSTSYWKLFETSMLTIRVTAGLRCKVGSSYVRTRQESIFRQIRGYLVSSDRLLRGLVGSTEVL